MSAKFVEDPPAFPSLMVAEECLDEGTIPISPSDADFLYTMEYICKRI